MPGGLVCHFPACRRSILSPEAALRVEVHRVGGKLVAFGRGMEAGLLDQAQGPLVRTYHGVCWWRQVKRDRLAAALLADPPGHPAGEREACDAEDPGRGLDGADGGAGAAPA